MSKKPSIPVGPDGLPNTGGSYVIAAPGAAPELIERTAPHPDGDRPRDQRGAPLDAPPPRPKPFLRKRDAKKDKAAKAG